MCLYPVEVERPKSLILVSVLMLRTVLVTAGVSLVRDQCRTNGGRLWLVSVLTCRFVSVCCQRQSNCLSVLVLPVSVYLTSWCRCRFVSVSVLSVSVLSVSVYLSLVSVGGVVGLCQCCQCRSLSRCWCLCCQCRSISLIGSLQCRCGKELKRN